MLYGKQPNLANLCTCGCHAYIRNQDLANTNKVAPKTLTGYLVGYKAAKARDVTFDESRLYDPDGPFLEGLIKEKAPKPPGKLLQLSRAEDLDSEPGYMALDSADSTKIASKLITHS
ncbi:hypothetical protein EYZ11_004215 [Aspergillus tanneri]|uniref:Uncharacterized protein n=1 Tax=Aspergillus tanneri TaxID=1220188 RepID=A0A4S3JLP5_9EURO|nr:hypothetical protein EYZ11_004215 [Aspergillus tanneri]